MLLAFTEVTFNLLCQQEHLAWCPFCFDEDHGIEELVCRLEAPGLCLDER